MKKFFLTCMLIPLQCFCSNNDMKDYIEYTLMKLDRYLPKKECDDMPIIVDFSYHIGYLKGKMAAYQDILERLPNVND